MVKKFTIGLQITTVIYRTVSPLVGVIFFFLVIKYVLKSRSALNNDYSQPSLLRILFIPSISKLFFFLVKFQFGVIQFQNDLGLGESHL